VRRSPTWPFLTAHRDPLLHPAMLHLAFQRPSENGRAILGFAPVTGGSISFRGQVISDLSRARRRELAREIQAVFQDSYSSLNPSMTIEDILVEPLVAVGSDR
jgi:ABC-type microcin C transport system duplicated ATPase subunit YejF